jgi:hypothetical protein
MTMEDREVEAWGRIYATLDAALKAATGRGLTGAERQAAGIRPQFAFGAVMRRAFACHAIDARMNAMIGILSRDIVAREVDGTTELTRQQRDLFSRAFESHDPGSFLVSAAEASRMLGVSKPRVTQLCQAGKLDSISDPGAGTFITRASVERRAAGD